MRRFVMMAGVLALAVGSANCAGSGENAGGLLGPTAAAPAALAEVGAMTEARGGGGGGGKPGGGGTTGGSGTLAVRMVSDVNGNGSPNWGDVITYDISTTATAIPTVGTTCSQSGVAVLVTEAGYYTGFLWPWLQKITLRTDAWGGGAASCVAKLYYYSGTSRVDLGSLSYSVGG